MGVGGREGSLELSLEPDESSKGGGRRERARVESAALHYEALYSAAGVTFQISTERPA